MRQHTDIDVDDMISFFIKVAKSDIRDYVSFNKNSVKLKLGKYFVLSSSVQKKGNGRVYTSDSLKLKLSSKCKFYSIDECTNVYKRISKEKAKENYKTDEMGNVTIH